MPETKLIEGVVTTAEYPEGKQGKVVIDGQTWFLEKPEYRGEPFHEPRKGENVRLGLEAWTKRDGSTGWTAKTSELLEPANVDALTGYVTALPTTDWGPKRRLDALQLMQAAALERSLVSQTLTEFAQSVVEAAEIYAEFIDRA